MSHKQLSHMTGDYQNSATSPACYRSEVYRQLGKKLTSFPLSQLSLNERRLSHLSQQENALEPQGDPYITLWLQLLTQQMSPILSS